MAEAVELVVPLLQGAVLVVEIDGALDHLVSMHMKWNIFSDTLQLFGSTAQMSISQNDSCVFPKITEDVRT